MSNRYYNFLSNRLIQWLNRRNNLKSGDKYFVLLDSLAEATNFYESLESVNFSGKLAFQSEEFSYSTVGLEKDKVKVLFVSPIKKLHKIFL